MHSFILSLPVSPTPPYSWPSPYYTHEVKQTLPAHRKPISQPQTNSSSTIDAPNQPSIHPHHSRLFAPHHPPIKVGSVPHTRTNHHMHPLPRPPPPPPKKNPMKAGGGKQEISFQVYDRKATCTVTTGKQRVSDSLDDGSAREGIEISKGGGVVRTTCRGPTSQSERAIL